MKLALLSFPRQENWKNLKIQEIESMISKAVFANDGSGGGNAAAAAAVGGGGGGGGVCSGGGDLKSNFDPVFFTFLKV